MYRSLDIRHDGQFALYPTDNPENQNFDKWKKRLEIYHFTHTYHNLWWYDLSFLRYEAWQNFLSFWTIFALLCPTKDLKIKTEKLKKTLEDITILHMYATNDNHNEQNVLSLWAIFYPFTPQRPVKPIF